MWIELGGNIGAANGGNVMLDFGFGERRTNMRTAGGSFGAMSPTDGHSRRFWLAIEPKFRGSAYSYSGGSTWFLPSVELGICLESDIYVVGSSNR